MPKYSYFCNECEEVFDTAHSLQKTLKICKICGHEDCLERKPSSIFISKKQDDFEGKSKDGDVVKEAIKDAKEELTSDRRKLERREYKDND